MTLQNGKHWAKRFSFFQRDGEITFFAKADCGMSEFEYHKIDSFKSGEPLTARLTCQSGNEIITNHFPIGHESPETVKTHLFESDDCKKKSCRVIST